MEQQFFRHIAQTSDESIGIPVERAEGIYLYGPDGRRWIDLISGICVSNLGHGDPDILQAIHAQADRYLHPMVYGEAMMSPQIQYATQLASVLGDKLDTVYFVNSGAETVEGAMKVAKKYTGRSRFVSCKKAYHGSTHGAMSLSDKSSTDHGYGPLLPGIDFIRFNAIEDLSLITEDTAAVFIEIVQGAGGMVLPQPSFLQAIQERCHQTGALLVVDEIQTGFGRTGALFAHQLFDVSPDILLLAKSLGGGLPLGAFISRAEILDVIRRSPPLGFITTFGGHPLSCAAGLALLNKLESGSFLSSIPAKEKIIVQHLQHPAIQEVRGVGLMYAVLFESRDVAEAVRKQAYEMGILTIGFLQIENGLRICPPLSITEEELLLVCRLLVQCIEQVAGE
ncbi:MAG: aspartate aminotransferase family protein [Bacteroidota bacterium]